MNGTELRQSEPKEMLVGDFDKDFDYGQNLRESIRLYENLRKLRIKPI